MKNFRSLSLAVISLGAASMLFTACNVEELFNGGHSSGKVLIDVTSDSGIDTKSGARPQQYDAIDLSSEGTPLFLTLTKSPNLENPFSEQIQTKGQVVTTDNLKSYRKTFDVTILNKGAVYGDATKADYDEKASPTKWPLNKDVNWPDDKSSLEFWAYSYEKDSEFKKGTSYSAFTYLGPRPGGEKNDASLTSDVLMAHTENQTVNNVPIHFYHALAAVRFHVSDAILGGATTTNSAGQVVPRVYNGVKVRVSGVITKGEAVFTGNQTDMYYSWTPSSSSEDVVEYEQVLLAGPNASKEDAEANYASENDRTFFFVPQNLSNVKFTFLITDMDGKEFVVSTLNLGVATWQPGYIYNYTVGNDRVGTVDVEVAEDFVQGESETKENVRVEMVKSSAAYVRVAVVANWCATGSKTGTVKVVAPYTGTINYNRTDWLEGEDGFFYSKMPVLGYGESENLIDSFTCPGEAPASIYQLHLEMNVLAQAVSYDTQKGNVTRAWGDVKVKGSTETVVSKLSTF